MMRYNRIKIYKINILIQFNNNYNKDNSIIILEYKIIDLNLILLHVLHKIIYLKHLFTINYFITNNY
jgi:hypothetical protein